MNLTEKLTIRGVESLSDCELLTLILDEDNSSLAENLLSSVSGSLSMLSSVELSRLRMIDGVGLHRAQRIVAALELGKRGYISSSAEYIIINNNSDVVKIFRPIMESLKHEECWVLYLNASNRIVEKSRVSQGGITATVVDHRLIIKRALELLATNMILVHNHPSGDVAPSSEDIALTHKIKEAAALFDIHLLDHIIIAPNSEFSFRKATIL